MHIFAQTRYNLFQLSIKESLLHVCACTPTLPAPTIKKRNGWLKLTVSLNPTIRLIIEYCIAFTIPWPNIVELWK